MQTKKNMNESTLNHNANEAKMITDLEKQQAEAENFQARWKDRLHKMHLSDIHTITPC